ncbi:MAG: hypothetical protein II623_01015, partial [Paludibacteraceae bacterium]|nr:hypothetical protein [Paludibacteraceae bacterium]
MIMSKMPLYVLAALMAVGCSTIENHQQAANAASESAREERMEAVEVQLDSVKTPEDALARLAEGN